MRPWWGYAGRVTTSSERRRTDPKAPRTSGPGHPARRDRHGRGLRGRLVPAALIGVLAGPGNFNPLPVLMKAPAEKAMGYTAVVIIAAIVLFLVIGLVAGTFMAGTFG